MAHASLGTVSAGTLRPEDLVDSFWHELQYRIQAFDWFKDSTTTERDKFVKALWDISETVWAGDGGEIVDDVEILESAVDEISELLQFFARPYTFFGAHDGDGADFGYWPCWHEIDELPKFDEFPDELPGEDFAVVSDHGNVTVYGADGREIVGIV